MLQRSVKKADKKLKIFVICFVPVRFAAAAARIKENI